MNIPARAMLLPLKIVGFAFGILLGVTSLSLDIVIVAAMDAKDRIEELATGKKSGRKVTNE